MSLQTKYRPKKLTDVVGQEEVVSALQGIIKRQSSQAFLFAGPAGTGKTTLARITARMLGCIRQNVNEIDGATFTGVDEIRQVQQSMQYAPFGEGNKAVIIDECHRLSKNAWDTLLKPIEEPPSYAFWFLCTTELGKVPRTIQTRCSKFQLKDIPPQTLGILYDRVCEAEKIDLPGDVGDVIINEASGSARQMLVNLDTCIGVESKKEALKKLHGASASPDVIALCRYLLQPGPWSAACTLIEKMDTTNAEGIRIVVRNYFAKVALGAKSDKGALWANHVLSCFRTPYNQSEQLAGLIESVAEVKFTSP
jgi:DNA polymerase-3 subunit gamma/tau